MNSIGNMLRLTTFGESHGAAIGGVLDGMPAGMRVDMDNVRLWMSRRRPGSTSLGTARREADEPQFISGLLDGVTTGAPIALVIPNGDARPADYDSMRDMYRPNHADYTYQMRYGMRDTRGGGRSSARWTAAVTAAGALAAQWLAGRHGIRIAAYTSRIGGVALAGGYLTVAEAACRYDNDVRCPDAASVAAMEAEILRARAEGDSVGGTVSCVIEGLPAGIGSPMFGKLSARLSAAMFSINAVKAFEIGDGVSLAEVRGSQVADEWIEAPDERRGIRTAANHSGGIQGGITNGEPVTFRVTFKPTPTISRSLRTVDSDGRGCELSARGRHDPCVVPRAVPVVEAMAALAVADALIEAHGYRQ